MAVAARCSAAARVGCIPRDVFPRNFSRNITGSFQRFAGPPATLLAASH
jgi:hypothetical protein